MRRPRARRLRIAIGSSDPVSASAPRSSQIERGSSTERDASVAAVGEREDSEGGDQRHEPEPASAGRSGSIPARRLNTISRR